MQSREPLTVSIPPDKVMSSFMARFDSLSQLIGFTPKIGHETCTHTLVREDAEFAQIDNAK